MTSSGITPSARPKLAPGVRLQKDPLTQEAVLLQPEGVIELNDSAAEIVSRCDGSNTVERIVEALLEEYDMPREEMFGDVSATLEGLLRRKLIVLETRA